MDEDQYLDWMEASCPTGERPLELVELPGWEQPGEGEAD